MFTTISSIRLRLIIGVTSVAIALTAGWQMASNPFWGYWGMALMLGSWFSLLAVAAPRIWKAGVASRMFLMSVGSGIALWLGFPDMPFFPLLFVAFVPLILIESDLLGQKRSLRRLLFYAFNTFFLWNVLSTFWVINTAFVAGIFANVVNAGLMVIPFAGYHLLRRSIGDRFRWSSLIAFWMVFEWVHLHWDLTWPFLNLSNAFAEWPVLIQWYEYTGGFGGTLWMWVGNVLVYMVYKKWRESATPVDLKAWLPFVIWILGPIAGSLVLYLRWEPQGTPIEVAVVQPNFEPHYEKFDIPQDEQYRRYRSLARSVLTPDTRYLVFPETSFGQFDLNQIDGQPLIRDLKTLLDSFPQCALITGLDPYRFLAPGERSPAQRAFVRPGQDTLWWEAYNMAAQLSSGQPDQFYIKGKLVPGAEIFPFRKLLFFMEPLVDQLGGSLEGLRRSDERSAFQHQGMAVGPVICYESVFGAYCNGYIHDGAQALAIITNDGWWDNTPGHRQHLRFGALRAIENRRDIIRSANTGISCLIDQRGEIHQPQAYGETSTFRGKVYLNSETTVYNRWGDVLARIAIFLTIMFVAYAGITALKARFISS